MNEHDMAEMLDMYDTDDPDAEHIWTDDNEIVAPADDEAAQRLMRWLAGTERQLARWNGLCDREVRRIEAFRADRTAGLIRRVDALKKAIEGWQRATGKSTVTTPWATSRLRSGRSKVFVYDEPKFVAWAVENDHPEMLKVTPVASAIGTLGEGEETAAALLSPALREVEQRMARLVIAGEGDEREIVPGVVFAVPRRKSWSIAPVVVIGDGQTGPTRESGD